MLVSPEHRFPFIVVQAGITTRDELEMTHHRAAKDTGGSIGMLHRHQHKLGVADPLMKNTTGITRAFITGISVPTVLHPWLALAVRSFEKCKFITENTIIKVRLFATIAKRNIW